MNRSFEANISFSDRIFSYVNFLTNYIDFVKLYRKRYKNFLSVIIHVLRNDYPVNATYKNGTKTRFYDYQEVYNNLMEIEVDPDNDLVYFNGMSFHGGKTNGDIVNVFKKNEYSFLPVNKKEVIDIGANIGDSSIYFASHGAKRVIAVEPDTVSYDHAVKNAAANGYSGVIQLIMASCGPRDFFALDNRLELLTLRTLIEKYCSCPTILKVDCEGCEYDLILKASSWDLCRFSHIQIEYHFGYQNLKNRLQECGFDVFCTTPSFFVPINKNRTTRLIMNGNASQSNMMFIGWLYATRLK